MDIFWLNYIIYIKYKDYSVMEILEWVKRQTGKLADNVKDYKFYVKS